MNEINVEYLDKISNIEFEEVDGLVLRREGWTEETVKAWKEKLGSDTTAIESVINHVHLVGFLWLGNEEDVCVNSLKIVGHKIKETWQKNLNKQFPHSTFEVRFNDQVESDGWVGNMSVTAYRTKENA